MMAFLLDGAPVASGGPADRLLPWDRVQDMTGISRTTAWRMQRAGAFPTRVTVSPGRVGWWESELSAWKHARIAAKPLAPPARPRLPGIARMPALKTSPKPVTITGEAPAATSTVVRGRARKGRAPVNQMDFGF